MMRCVIICSIVLWCGLVQAGSLDLHAILERLINARGEPRADYPSLSIQTRERSIAAYSPSTNTIIIEQKAIETCKTLGGYADDALAFLISHELTHFFQHRLWQRNTEQIAFFATRAQLEQVRSYEIEADTYGAFLCYLAGYNYRDAAPRIIEALYEAYQIDSASLAQYPAPAERKAFTISVCDQVTEYAILFESARALSHFGGYRWSHAINKYLLRYLDFQEIYMNTGANQLQWLLANERQGLQFPIIFKERLSLRGGAELSQDSLLKLAENNTLIAIRKNPSDHHAFINLGCIYLAKNDFNSYEDLINQLGKVNHNDQISDQMAVLESIYLFKRGEQKKALKRFSNIKSSTKNTWINSICTRNISILKGKSNQRDIRPSDGQNYFPDRVQGYVVSEKVLDDSDPLFPMQVRISQDEKSIQIELTDGDQKLILWKMKDGQLMDQHFDNSLVKVRPNEQSQWFIQGL